jgi:hypothetical protein
VKNGQRKEALMGDAQTAGSSCGRGSIIDLAADPVLAQFPPWRGTAKAGFHAGYLGEMTDARFVTPGGRLFRKIGATEDAHADRQVNCAYPPVGEEIFEWQALLAALLDVRDRFVMVDAGAGFGRWLVSAVCGLRRRSSTTPFHLVGIEAEPTHFEWMAQHLRTNGIDPAQHQLLHARGRRRERNRGATHRRRSRGLVRLDPGDHVRRAIC